MPTTCFPYFRPLSSQSNLCPLQSGMLAQGTWTIYPSLTAKQCIQFSSPTTIATTTLPTIVTSIGRSLHADSFNGAATSALVALAAVWQCVIHLPSFAAYRKSLFLLLLLPGIAMIHRYSSVASWDAQLFQTTARPDLHPIEKLAAAGQAQSSHLLTTQSITLKQAATEYLRRYGRYPPPGFDKWFVIAKREEYVLFDEFDTVMETLKPFWGIPARELRCRVDAAFEDSRLIRFNISNANIAFDNEGWAPWMGVQVQSWLPPEWRLILPNMTFAVNVLDEPRVLAPFDTLSNALHRADMSRPLEHKSENLEVRPSKGAEVGFLRVDRRNAWEALTSACIVETTGRNNSSLQAQRRATEFVANTTDQLDVCLHPGLHETHGFLSSPDSLHITHSLVPLFSQGKPSIFSDVLFPSPYYAGKMDQEEYVKEEDPDWNKKSDTLYWSGATTGGYATMENWETLHRQRLLLSLTSSRPTSLVTLLNETSPGQWDPYLAPMSDLRPLFKLKMTDTVQCEVEACDVERIAFNIIPFDVEEENPNKESINVTYQSRYALDMDGNGFSGRYYRLLKSKSAVIKQTIFKEWHDGHLVPWVHYIPLSMDAEELPEMMRFLTQDRRGRQLGKRIARESRSWANITLRKIDLQLAFLRLLLEYGRLMSDDRDTLNYKA